MVTRRGAMAYERDSSTGGWPQAMHRYGGCRLGGDK
jgi:hypothetical protein